MNKAMLVVVVILSVAVVLLSGAVFYFSKCKCQGQSSPCCNFGNRMNMRMPFPSEQDRPMPGNMPPVFNPGGQPDFMGGPNMGGDRQGQRPQRGPNMDGGRQGMGQQGGPVMGGEQGRGQSGSQEQISTMMQEATQEAQNYFRSQKRKPGHQEMLNKVKELMTQKMNAQGISQDVQQQVFSGMNQKGPPQPRE